MLPGHDIARETDHVIKAYLLAFFAFKISQTMQYTTPKTIGN